MAGSWAKAKFKLDAASVRGASRELGIDKD
jgi:hypothetical protein